MKHREIFARAVLILATVKNAIITHLIDQWACVRAIPAEINSN